MYQDVHFMTRVSVNIEKDATNSTLKTSVKNLNVIKNVLRDILKHEDVANNADSTKKRSVPMTMSKSIQLVKETKLSWKK